MPSCPCTWCWIASQPPISKSSMERSKAANKATQIVHCLKGLKLSYTNYLWPYHTALACSLHKNIRYFIWIMLPRESFRVEKRGHHHRRNIDSWSYGQVPPDLCSHHPCWWMGDVRNRMKGKTGMARSTHQLGQNWTKNLTSEKRGKNVKMMYFCFSKMKRWDFKKPVSSEKWS